MSYNKYTKYKIMDMKHNKQLINDEMVVAKMPLDISEPKITIAMVMKTLTEFMTEQRKFNKEQIKFNEEQRKFNGEIKSDINDLKVRMTKVESRLDKIDEFNKTVQTYMDSHP